MERAQERGRAGGSGPCNAGAGCSCGAGSGDVAADVAEAAEMLGKSAAAGYNPAMTELGKQLLRNEAHAEEGLQMLDLGAAAGDPEAHYVLFQVYSKGKGEIVTVTRREDAELLVLRLIASADQTFLDTSWRTSWPLTCLPEPSWN